MKTVQRGVAELWLEDVAGRPGPDWAAADYSRAAYDLGTTQGAYAAGLAPLPDPGWLSREWLAGWVRTTQRWWPLVSDEGIGGLAQDLDQLTLDPVWMQVVPDGDLDVLESAVLPAYADGVRDAGAEPRRPAPLVRRRGRVVDRAVTLAEECLAG